MQDKEWKLSLFAIIYGQNLFWKIKINAFRKSGNDCTAATTKSKIEKLKNRI
jgi:hypothetical protein